MCSNATKYIQGVYLVYSTTYHYARDAFLQTRIHVNQSLIQICLKRNINTPSLLKHTRHSSSRCCTTTTTTVYSYIMTPSRASIIHTPDQPFQTSHTYSVSYVQFTGSSLGTTGKDMSSKDDTRSGNLPSRDYGKRRCCSFRGPGATILSVHTNLTFDSQRLWVFPLDGNFSFHYRRRHISGRGCAAATVSTSARQGRSCHVSEFNDDDSSRAIGVLACHAQSRKCHDGLAINCS